MRQIIFILSMLLVFTGIVDAKVKRQATKKKAQTVSSLKEPTSPLVTESELKGRAKELYQKAVDGDANAQYELASCFLLDDGTHNYQDGFYWAKKSADKNHPGGAYCLGFVMRMG